MEPGDPTRLKTRALLLERAGLVFVDAPAAPGPRLAERYVQGVGLTLADLGFALSARLSERLATLSLDELTALQSFLRDTLAATLGADRQHVPLFRKFPYDVPDDTEALWWQKVLSHFLQAEGQPCLFCRQVGTTHVLQPCRHVVCDRCFDGASYSACPVCEHHVDLSSPFFLPTPETRAAAPEPVRFKLLDLGVALDEAARDLFLAFCRRPQALSPADAAAFTVLLTEYGERALAWLPPAIPVKEIAAQALGTLFRIVDPQIVLPVARRYLATATDVLRLLAAMSGADPSLLPKTVYQRVARDDGSSRRFWGKIAEMLGAAPQWNGGMAYVPLRVHRFKVARLSRPLRRALLAILEGLDADLLIEDMLRHRAWWVWVGEFLHPHEFAQRFPQVARAFAIVRKKGPDGTPAPPFQGYYGKLEAAVAAGDAAAMTALLARRPGELARRFDHALRVAAGDAAAEERLLAAFVAAVPVFATPVLLTLWKLLPTRTHPAPVRVYWPKGQVATGAASADTRATLRAPLVERAARAAEAELLRRFAAQPPVGDAVIDAALQEIVAPFNERTASPAAVALPRGSRVALPSGKLLRLFLHWCEPEKGGETTDLDLSIGFYDAGWRYVGVCSYYQLKLAGSGDGPIAVSAGDLRNAPFPNGASELVDLDRERAAAAGIRYAAMVVTNYAGMPFALLERAFAGVMLRASGDGPHFDPRTVELRFNLQGENGVFLPMVVDLDGGTLHWLDVYSKGKLALNNVATSNAAITQIGPNLLTYFASGVRASLYDVALFHAAARATRVHLRQPGGPTALFARREGEESQAFLDRLRGGAPDASGAPFPDPSGPPVFAALYRGDLELPAGSTVYALFREGLTGTSAASDLLA